MTVWVVKPGRYGAFEERMLENSVVALGWADVPDLRAYDSRDALKEAFRRLRPGASPNKIGNEVGQLWAFSHEMKPSDIVLVPLKRQAAVAAGSVEGEYEYRTDLGDDMPHIRRVEWKDKAIPRSRFGQDLLYTFGSYMTVSTATRNNAEQRIRKVLEGKADPMLDESQGSAGGASGTQDGALKDFERASLDQVVAFIGRKFKGHGLAMLVEAVLKAEGYTTLRSDPGPDGGVDILASRGTLGFEQPKICVQVKSGDVQLDSSELQRLKGVMQDTNADQGLLVSWSGFKPKAEKDARNSFFQVRLWDSDDLVQAIFRDYDRLPDEIKAQLPLKRIWTLAAEELEE